MNRTTTAMLSAVAAALLPLPLLAGVVRQPDIPRYSVDLAQPADVRWVGPLNQFVAHRGVAPFLAYYDALHKGLAANDAAAYAFYKEQLPAFQKAYADLYPESFGEIVTLGAVLLAHCSGEECSRLSWERVFLAQMHMQIQNISPDGGECTSMVVQPAEGSIIHARNWDFGPRSDALGSAQASIDFRDTDGSHFTCLMALTHITKWTTCIRPGAYSMSLNARSIGEDHERGRPPAEELRLLQSGWLPRTQVIRRVMLTKSFDGAVAAARDARALTSVYVILADARASASGGRGGAVVTVFGGSDAKGNDVWPLTGRGGGEDWFLVQTNVDHWVPAAQDQKSSHRREHVRALLRALGPASATPEALAKILEDPSKFPADNAGPDDGVIFRPETIATVIMRPSEGLFVPTVWRALPQDGAAVPFPALRGPVSVLHH